MELRSSVFISLNWISVGSARIVAYLVNTKVYCTIKNVSKRLFKSLLMVKVTWSIAQEVDKLYRLTMYLHQYMLQLKLTGLQRAESTG